MLIIFQPVSHIATVSNIISVSQTGSDIISWEREEQWTLGWPQLDIISLISLLRIILWLFPSPAVTAVMGPLLPSFSGYQADPGPTTSHRYCRDAILDSFSSAVVNWSFRVPRLSRKQQTIIYFGNTAAPQYEEHNNVGLWNHKKHCVAK